MEYNKKRFPEYVFDGIVKKNLFVDFDIAFSEAFIIVLKKFLIKNQVQTIEITNIIPKAYSFKKQVNVFELPESYIKITYNLEDQDYIQIKASFYMLTECATVCPIDNKDLIIIYLDRQYGLAIIGFSNESDCTFFSDFKLENLFAHLTMAFNGNVPNELKKKVQKNWHYQNDY